MEITARPPPVFVKGEGSWLWDHNGKRYLDFVQGWAVNCLGHSPAAVVNTISRQAREGRRKPERWTWPDYTPGPLWESPASPV
jgi:acetylornithine/succinyldiaminopimelate/putrescine aminotransferase